jgi:hypothetical protein
MVAEAERLARGFGPHIELLRLLGAYRPHGGR